LSIFPAGALEAGFWLETASSVACEIAAMVGYRFVLFDMEHGILTVNDLDLLVPLCRGLAMKVFIRAAAAERLHIQQALDTGADGVIVPQIESAKHGEAVAALAKYPTLGTRGMGYGRATAYGGVTADLPDRDNKTTQCYLMIETAGALMEVAAIAKLQTVDGLFLGPSDLSLSRGFGTYKGTQQDFADARKMAQAAIEAGKDWGLPALGEKQLRLAKELRANFITVSDDRTALRVGALQHLEFTRRILGAGSA
jgi:4-hydroxy-2-oxoheptanedioate aldolase